MLCCNRVALLKEFFPFSSAASLLLWSWLTVLVNLSQHCVRLSSSMDRIRTVAAVVVFVVVVLFVVVGVVVVVVEL